MESSDCESPATGIAWEFPMSDGVLSCTTPSLPERLRRRLSEPKTPSPSTVEEIEAKLREADLRRQKFYEDLSSKARPKPKSPSLTSSNENSLGKRLEARLQAAEEKRLSMLANEQIRLAKLDESRQAAKTQVEMRLKKECAELGTKVNMRIQQAEANRLLFLKSSWQKRVALRERAIKSLMWQAARETKYKERVSTAIYKKRVSAENKRLGLLESEKQRARDRVLQARKVASAISRQRQIERVDNMNKLEDRLQRARRKRAEYIKHRGRLSHSFDSSLESMHVQAEIVARKLARCWRKFTNLNRTTAYLVKAFKDLNISEMAVKSMPFEQFSVLIQSNDTLGSTRALLDRLEVRYKLSRCTPYQSSWDDLDHLLKRVATPRKESPKKVISHGGKSSSTRTLTQSAFHTSRYLVRIVLCAYMIVGHPDAVISGKGDRETALVKSAKKFVKEFDLLVKILLNGPLQIPNEETASGTLMRQTFRSQLAAFDSAWCAYLNSFVVWKTKDARSLEEDLIRAACRLELSMIQTCKRNPKGDSGSRSHYMNAIQKEVSEDQKLLRENVMHLSGDAGIERMDNALYATRTNFFGSREKGSPDTSLTTDVLSRNPLALSSIDDKDKDNNLNMGSQKQSSVSRTLFKAGIHPKEVRSAVSSHSVPEFSQGSSEMENVRIVNEYVHGERLALDDISNSVDEQSSYIMAKIKDTMERAFWDRVIESVKQNDYNHVVELMREVRNEICSMTPHSWRQEIVKAIDLDILMQILNMGKLDLDYLGKILKFSLDTLCKLSAPAYEDELKKRHLQFMRDLAEECASDSSQNSQVIALIKGLRFTLEQIQGLKQEISKARIRLLEPFLKGRDALLFLREAFANSFGPSSNASAALPLTAKWISSAQEGKDTEWNEHRNSLSELTKRNDDNKYSVLPSTALRSGGSYWVKTSKSPADEPSSDYAGSETIDLLRGCKGGDIDLLVRLGLLKLVNKITSWSEAELPETMNLNFFRLRNVQSRVQKIIVVSTSILILRETLLTQPILSSQSQIGNILFDCIKQLSQCLDSVADAGIHDIIKVLIATVQKESKSEDSELQTTKEIMARMLSKSLLEEDTVFIRVSRAIYLALRGVVLGGTGKQGKELAEVELNKIGMSPLLNEVLQAATVLVTAANVSVAVHSPWYSNLVSK